MKEPVPTCTSRALRKIAASIRLAVSEDEIDRQAVEDAARQLMARVEMIEGGME